MGEGLGGASTCLLVATAGAIVSYIPIGALAAKIGRKRTIQCGIVLLATCFMLGYLLTTMYTSIQPIMYVVFALVGLAAGSTLGVQAMLMYMTIYAVMNVGTFAFILSMERDGLPVTDLASLNRFAWTDPVKALALLVLMFSLAGVPPMLGFFAKYAVLTAAVDAGLGWLAVFGPWVARLLPIYLKPRADGRPG